MCFFFFLMLRRPPRSTRTDTLFPSPTLFRSRMIGQGGGAIVNLASPAGFHAVPRVGPYSISKAGMVMLTKQTAREYAAEGIRANAVAPGVTRTPILDDLPAAHLDQKIGRAHV